MTTNRQISTVDLESPCVVLPGRTPSFQRSAVSYENRAYDVEDGSCGNTQTFFERDLKAKHYQKRYHNCFLLCGGLILIILLNIGISLLINKYGNGRNNASMCIPCDDLILSEDEFDDYRGYFKSTVNHKGKPTQCCAETSEQLKIMLDVVCITLFYYLRRVSVFS